MKPQRKYIPTHKKSRIIKQDPASSPFHITQKQQQPFFDPAPFRQVSGATLYIVKNNATNTSQRYYFGSIDSAITLLQLRKQISGELGAGADEWHFLKQSGASHWIKIVRERQSEIKVSDIASWVEIGNTQAQQIYIQHPNHNPKFQQDQQIQKNVQQIAVKGQKISKLDDLLFELSKSQSKSKLTPEQQKKFNEVIPQLKVKGEINESLRSNIQKYLKERKKQLNDHIEIMKTYKRQPAALLLSSHDNQICNVYVQGKHIPESVVDFHKSGILTVDNYNNQLIQQQVILSKKQSQTQLLQNIDEKLLNADINASFPGPLQVAKASIHSEVSKKTSESREQFEQNNYFVQIHYGIIFIKGYKMTADNIYLLDSFKQRYMELFERYIQYRDTEVSQSKNNVLGILQQDIRNTILRYGGEIDTGSYIFGGKYLAKEQYQFRKKLTKYDKEKIMKIQGGLTVSTSLQSMGIAELGGGISAGKTKNSNKKIQNERQGYTINRNYDIKPNIKDFHEWQNAIKINSQNWRVIFTVRQTIPITRVMSNRLNAPLYNKAQFNQFLQIWDQIHSRINHQEFRIFNSYFQKYLTRGQGGLKLQSKKDIQDQLWQIDCLGKYIVIRSNDGRRNLSSDPEGRIRMQYDADEWNKRWKVRTDDKAHRFVINQKLLSVNKEGMIKLSNEIPEGDDWIIEDIDGISVQLKDVFRTTQFIQSGVLPNLKVENNNNEGDGKKKQKKNGFFSRFCLCLRADRNKHSTTNTSSTS